jgi:hypothetical protein
MEAVYQSKCRPQRPDSRDLLEAHHSEKLL